MSEQRKRGGRKYGQFHVKVWLPDGYRYAEWTERNLPPEDFVKALNEAIERMQILSSAHKSAHSEGGAARHAE